MHPSPGRFTAGGMNQEKYIISYDKTYAIHLWQVQGTRHDVQMRTGSHVRLVSKAPTPVKVWPSCLRNLLKSSSDLKPVTFEIFSEICHQL